MRFSATLTSLFASSVLAITTPPTGALVVGTSSAAKYKTVQAAVTAAASGATIFIEAGTYKEQVFVPAAKKNLKIIGYSSTDASYEGNKVTIVQGQAQDSQSKPNNDLTATLRAYGDGMKVYNVNLVNSRGVGSQALALSAFGDQLGFYGCQLTGNQDTVMSQKGKHYFAKSLIAGNTDFIFGQYGVLWIDQCVIQCVKANTGYITGKPSSHSLQQYCEGSANFTPTQQTVVRTPQASPTTSSTILQSTVPPPPEPSTSAVHGGNTLVLCFSTANSPASSTLLDGLSGERPRRRPTTLRTWSIRTLVVVLRLVKGQPLESRPLPPLLSGLCFRALAGLTLLSFTVLLINECLCGYGRGSGLDIRKLLRGGFGMVWLR